MNNNYTVRDTQADIIIAIGSTPAEAAANAGRELELDGDQIEVLAVNRSLLVSDTIYRLEIAASRLTDEQIIAIARAAKTDADLAHDNWADIVDAALTAAGVETDEAAARDLAGAGRLDVVAVLADGRVIECWDDQTWHVTARAE